MESLTGLAAWGGMDASNVIRKSQPSARELLPCCGAHLPAGSRQEDGFSSLLQGKPRSQLSDSLADELELNEAEATARLEVTLSAC
jgi:hypothetical protein